MADKYPSTLLAQQNSPTEIQKADLDLLKKINEEAARMAVADNALNTKLTRVTDLDAIRDNRFFAFTNTAKGAPIDASAGAYDASGISIVDKEQQVQLVLTDALTGFTYRVRDGSAWGIWKRLVDSSNISVYSVEDFLIASTGVTANNFPVTVIAAGTVGQGVKATNHPGVLRITSSTTTNSGALAGTQASVAINDVYSMGAVIKPLTFTATVTTRFGLHNATTITAPTEGIFFELVGSSLVGKVVGSYGTYTSSPYTLVVDTWYQLRILSRGTTIVFEVWNNAGTDMLVSWTTIIVANNTANSVTFISTFSGVVATAIMDVDLLKLELFPASTRII